MLTESLTFNKHPDFTFIHNCNCMHPSAVWTSVLREKLLYYLNFRMDFHESVYKASVCIIKPVLTLLCATFTSQTWGLLWNWITNWLFYIPLSRRIKQKQIFLCPDCKPFKLKVHYGLSGFVLSSKIKYHLHRTRQTSLEVVFVW